MEEILSSIRRIIADEEAHDSAEDHELGAGQARSEALDDDSEELARAAEHGEDAEEDVLELTKVVRESGEVVDLQSERSSVGDPMDEAPDQADDGGQQSELSAADHAQEDQSGADHLEAAADHAYEEQVAADHGHEEQAVADHGHEELAAADHLQEEEPTAATQDHTQRKDRAVPSEHAITKDLVSATSASVATGAFAKLTEALQRTPENETVADGSGRTVEQFVEDIVRPMLKEWLDEHLATIVERLVQKEISKISRRAELI